MKKEKKKKKSRGVGGCTVEELEKGRNRNGQEERRLKPAHVSQPRERKSERDREKGVEKQGANRLSQRLECQSGK